MAGSDPSWLVLRVLFLSQPVCFPCVFLCWSPESSPKISRGRAVDIAVLTILYMFQNWIYVQILQRTALILLFYKIINFYSAIFSIETFAIFCDTNIANVTDLLGYDFRLKFNSNILNATSVVAGDFFGENITIWHNIINNEAGIVNFAVTPEPETTTEGTCGVGRSATITFSVKAYGNSSLKLKGFIKLSGSDEYKLIV